MKAFVATVTFFVTILCCASGEARLFGATHRYQLHVNHDKGSAYICDLCPTAQRRIVWSTELAPSAEFKIGPGDELELWIDEPNPLLFRYEFDSRQVTKNADADAAEKMTDSLGSLVKIFGPTGAGNQAEKIGTETPQDVLRKKGITDVFLDDLIGSVQALASHQGRLQEHII